MLAGTRLRCAGLSPYAERRWGLFECGIDPQSNAGLAHIARINALNAISQIEDDIRDRLYRSGKPGLVSLACDALRICPF